MRYMENIWREYGKLANMEFVNTVRLLRKVTLDNYSNDKH